MIVIGIWLLVVGLALFVVVYSFFRSVEEFRDDTLTALDKTGNRIEQSIRRIQGVPIEGASYELSRRLEELDHGMESLFRTINRSMELLSDRNEALRIATNQASLTHRNDTSSIGLQENNIKDVDQKEVGSSTLNREERLRHSVEEESHPTDGGKYHDTEHADFDELLSLYAHAQNDQSERSSFNKRLTPERIGVSNNLERQKDPRIQPIFKTDQNGDYQAIKIVDTSEEYAVFPKFGLTITREVFNSGALSELYECPGMDTDSAYSRVTIEQPAFMRKSGDTWRVSRKGTLSV